MAPARGLTLSLLVLCLASLGRFSEGGRVHRKELQELQRQEQASEDASVARAADGAGADRQLEGSEGRRGSAASVQKSGGEGRNASCCCKESGCNREAKSASGSPAVYSPDHGLCCKFQSRCSYFWGHTIKAKSPDFCRKPQGTRYREPNYKPLPSALKPGSSHSSEWKPKPNTPGHTVDTYCDMQSHSPMQVAEQEQAVDSEGAAAADTKKRRNAVIGELVRELSKNSLDSMAKDIFSIYVCVRWAPNQEFMRLARDEIETEQLPKDADPYDLYAAGNFIPMRCSRNVNVYDVDRSSNETHYKYFEEAVLSIARWLEGESTGEVKRRLVEVEGADATAIKTSAKAFDPKELAQILAKCPSGAESHTSIHVKDATIGELLSNCAAARWWHGKLADWHTAFPFTSFMSPSNAAAVHAPKKDQQVLVCFGKRVASQMHRRAGGNHLMADQSAVGCHGFWDFGESARMLKRTVWLWRPPTCQLAALELDIKLKLMDAIATMNTQLFDALPSVILDEHAGQPMLTDGSPLTPAGTIGTLGSLSGDAAVSVAGSLGWLVGLNKQYMRLGHLLGNTVVKWAICPLRPLADIDEERRLDGLLGTEDDVARYYAQEAYSKMTGTGNALPGEECRKEQDAPVGRVVPRCAACSLGIMQESMPEPYRDQHFVCPVRPLLPAREQLKVLEKKTETCFMHMTGQQWIAKEWMYRGHTPQRRQYNLTENAPAAAYESVKIVSWRRAPDTQLGVWRDFVTYGRRCTEEEYAATPRWCQEPAATDSSTSGIGYRALQGVGHVASGTAGAVRAGLELAGVAEESPPWNKAIGERMLNWAYGSLKRVERGVRATYASLLGRAKARQARLYARLFAEVEAGELLHSASFQKELPKTGADSKARQRYDRYVITCPCPKFDPEREFRLKYTWSEHALRLAYRAEGKFSGGIVEQPAFTVELQGGSVLHMKDGENAWQDSYTFIRTGVLGGERSEWKLTRDPFLNQMVGVDPASFFALKIAGLRATFVCGSRKAMHDLPFDAPPPPVPFGKCVKDGVVRNKELKEASPNALFFAEETVVRVTLSALDTCYHEHSAAPAAAGPPPKQGEPVFSEADNSVYKGFSRLGEGCQKPGEEVKRQLPKALQSSMASSTYRGIFVAKGLPEDTLLEVLLDPADVVDELQAV